MNILLLCVGIQLFLACFFGGAWLYWQIREMQMMADLFSRLPQTEEEWEKWREDDEKFFWHLD